jgi:uncharacterized protein YeaO (DUF488 family)
MREISNSKEVRNIKQEFHKKEKDLEERLKRYIEDTIEEKKKDDGEKLYNIEDKLSEIYDTTARSTRDNERI